MIVVDSNVLMYAAGAEHPHKGPSVDFLQRVAEGEIDAIVNAETLQEVLHRYRSIRRWEDGRRVYDLTRRLFPSVQPITDEILDEARRLLDRYTHLVARDAVHAAVCRHVHARALCSYDTDFDSIAEIRRIEPGDDLIV